MRRRLDAELVRRGLAASRARAVEVIDAGEVLVGGMPAANAATRVDESSAIVLTGPPPRFVSRGGDKLAAALDRFGIDPRGRRSLDAGASTGGFTDCLLQRGAASVVAIDVGRGQLAWSLRTDPRVEVHERTNLRGLLSIGEPAQLAVADLSFISLRTVAPALARLTAPDADLVLLCKPQFEAGRERVGKGGIVRDPAVHRSVLGEVVGALAADGLVVVAVVPSPLRGADGNVEFLLHAVKRGSVVGDDVLDAAVAAAPARRGEPTPGGTGDAPGEVTR
ncbi:MAG: TlyA family RNA methyltransferase [Acidimicrobiia bacterium]